MDAGAGTGEAESCRSAVVHNNWSQTEGRGGSSSQKEVRTFILFDKEIVCFKEMLRSDT